MKEVAISEFKAKCLSILEEVRKTKRPIRVTRRGKPVADVMPPDVPKNKSILGSLVGSARITGDILAPVIDLNEFEAWRD